MIRTAARPRVLVTGGLGFVGSFVCRRLVTSGYGVAVFDDCRLGRPENLDASIRPDMLCVAGDVRDTDALVSALREFRPDVVVHLAAVHFVPLCNSEPRLAIDVNVGGTQSVLDGCRQVGSVGGVVFASSGAVYGPSDQALHESHDLAPTDLYGLTKLWGEQLVSIHRARTGMGLAIARLFNVYGPRETNPHFIPSLLVQVSKGNQLELGNLDTRRDYVYAADAAAALEMLVDRVCGDTSLTCNVGSGSAHAGRDIVTEIEAIVGRTFVTRVDRERIRISDRPVLLSDPSRASEQLGWSASTPLKEGLLRALADPIAAGVDIT